MKTKYFSETTYKHRGFDDAVVYYQRRLQDVQDSVFGYITQEAWKWLDQTSSLTSTPWLPTFPAGGMVIQKPNLFWSQI